MPAIFNMIVFSM